MPPFLLASLSHMAEIFMSIGLVVEFDVTDISFSIFINYLYMILIDPIIIQKSIGNSGDPGNLWKYQSSQSALRSIGISKCSENCRNYTITLATSVTGRGGGVTNVGLAMGTLRGRLPGSSMFLVSISMLPLLRD